VNELNLGGLDAIYEMRKDHSDGDNLFHSAADGRGTEEASDHLT
jgi:hypothetical protein